MFPLPDVHKFVEQLDCGGLNTIFHAQCLMRVPVDCSPTNFDVVLVGVGYIDPIYLGRCLQFIDD